MAPSLLKKKTKSQDAENQRASTTEGSSQRTYNAPRHPPPGSQPARPREPEYRPVVLSIMDQEWVHQVGVCLPCAYSLEDSINLWPRRT